MEVRIDIEGFYWLQNNCWSGALDRLKEIEENNFEDEFMDYLTQCFYDTCEIPTMTEINDFIWFEIDDWIEEMKDYR